MADNWRETVKAEALHLLGRNEGPKVEFKRSYPGDDKMAKLVSAIANTDDTDGGIYANEKFRNHGFILIGVEGGQVVGYDAWEPGFGSPQEASNEEKVKDKLEQKLKNLIAPLPVFEVYKFAENGVTFWVVLIRPSIDQPHVYDPQGSASVWVRVGSNITPARAQDYDRFRRNFVSALRQEFAGRMDALDNRISRLSGRIDALDGLFGSSLGDFFRTFTSTLSKENRSRSARNIPQATTNGAELSRLGKKDFSLEEVVRSMMPLDPIEEALNKEAGDLWEALSQLSWTFEDDTELAEAIEKVEKHTLPFLRGLGTLVERDYEERYANVTLNVLQGLSALGAVPDFITRYSLVAPKVRLYALLLTVYHVGILAYFHSRPRYLSVLSYLTYGREERRWLPHLRDTVYAGLETFFSLKHKQCDPLSGQIYNYLFINPGATWEALPEAIKRQPRPYHPLSPSGALDIFVEGEFVLGLLSLKPQIGSEEPPRPLFGLYLLESSPSTRIQRVIQKPPKVLCEVLGLENGGLQRYMEALRGGLKGVGGSRPGCHIGGTWWDTQPGPCPTP
ncbi:AlbA family DNA-binding domain-containing protein [Thermus caldifontis]|uniref:AlbA family DNA-binding domain-containing protein n=1 Tax=Thermus caldifontis TaxID=1930763 RepID=UPI000DF2069F|nr:ATP-binding protein [Thermus caldifontis]